MIWDVSFGLNLGTPTFFKIARLKPKIFQTVTQCKTGFPDLEDSVAGRGTVPRTASTKCKSINLL
jgi:hypothetical protein